jgi:hypothetical protein
VAPERGKGGDDATDADLTRPKNEKKSRGRFS